MLCSAFPMLLICFLVHDPPCALVNARTFTCVCVWVCECVCGYTKCIEWHVHIAARVHDSWTSYPILRNLAQVWDVQSISSVPQFRNRATYADHGVLYARFVVPMRHPRCMCAGVGRCLNIAENCIDFVQSRRKLKELSHSPMHSILFMVFVDDLGHPGCNEYG